MMFFFICVIYLQFPNPGIEDNLCSADVQSPMSWLKIPLICRLEVICSSIKLNALFEAFEDFSFLVSFHDQ